MIENADVEWLRVNSDDSVEWVVIDGARARRLLDHIDKLEAEIMIQRANAERATRLYHERPPAMTDRRPTVHEIAVQMMAALVASDDRCLLLETLANESYRAAEALVAEGRRLDGSPR